MGETGDTTSTGGEITQDVGKFLQGSDVSDSIVWVGKVVSFRRQWKRG